VKPPSPTGIKEQALADLTIADEKETDSSGEWNSNFDRFACNHSCADLKEADNSGEWNSNYGRFACNHSCADLSSEGDVSGDPNDSEVTKRWRDLTKIINMKMEDFHDSFNNSYRFQNLFPGDLGEFAMTAVEKNRNEMKEILLKIDKEAKGIKSTVVSPMSWLWDKKPASCISDASTIIETSLPAKSFLGDHALVCGNDSIYRRTTTTCTYMTGCSTTRENIPEQENDVIIMVKLPSD